MASLLVVAIDEPDYDTYRRRGFTDVVLVRPTPQGVLDPRVPATFDRAWVSARADDPALRHAITYALDRVGPGPVEVPAATPGRALRGLVVTRERTPAGWVAVRQRSRRLLGRRRDG